MEDPILGQKNCCVYARKLLSKTPAGSDSAPSIAVELEAIPGTVAVADNTGTISQVNQRLLQTTGFSTSEMIGKKITHFWGESHNDLPAIMSRIDDAGFWQDSIQHKKKSGEIFYELCSISKVFSGDEQKFHLLKVGHPISAPVLEKYHKKTASAFGEESDPEQREASYRNILDLAPFSILLIRVSDLKYILVNETFCRKMGYAKEEILGKTSLELNFFKTAADADRYAEALRRNGQVEKMEFEFQSKNGRALDALVSACVTRFKGEYCILSISADISELKKVQRILRESEAAYRTILETAPNAITITRLSDGCYMEVNNAFIKRTGYSRMEALGRNATDLNLYADPADRIRLLETFQKQGYLDGFEVKFQDRNGQPLETLVSASPIRYKGQDCLLFMSSKIDALKATERALKEREENYRTILDMAPYTIVVSRRNDGKYIQVNRAFTKRTGYSFEETAGKTPFDLDLYADPSDRKRLVDALNRHGFVNSMEVKFRAKDGHIMTSLISMSPILYNGENCIISMTVDISELKAAQKALQESEARFRTIFETAADPIFLNDMQSGRFLDVNHAACRHLGYDRSEFLKMSLNQINDPDVADPLTYFCENDSDAKAVFFESKHVRKDGSKAVVEVSSQQMMHQDRKVLLSIVRDVTQRKQTEEELSRHRENLEQLVADRTYELKAAQNELVKQEKLAVLGQLTATVSHELRNPLGVIRSSNFFLQRKIGLKDEKTAKHFKRIDEQISLCDAIVADLLEYTRGRNISVARQDIAQWLTQVVETQKEQEYFDLEMKLAPDLPKISYDREKMHRVIVNLLTNAVQAVKAKIEDAHFDTTYFKPKITLEVSRQRDCIKLEVIDNGIGMNPETLRRAFEPLFTTRARGTGIGLAIVKKIVEEHGGQISLESRVGHGTRISFTLPFDS